MNRYIILKLNQNDELRDAKSVQISRNNFQQKDMLKCRVATFIQVNLSCYDPRPHPKQAPHICWPKPACESLRSSRVTPSSGPCVHITESQISSWHLEAIIAPWKAWGIN